MTVLVPEKQRYRRSQGMPYPIPSVNPRTGEVEAEYLGGYYIRPIRGAGCDVGGRADVAVAAARRRRPHTEASWPCAG